MKQFNFVLVCDSKTIAPTSVAIASVINNVDSKFKCNFFVFAYDYLDKPSEFIYLEKKFGCIITVISTSKYNRYFDYSSKEEFMNKWISFATYHRLLIFKILPKNIDFVTYLDTDIIINKDLTSILLEFEKSNKLFAAVAEVEVIKDKNLQYSYLENNPYFKKFFENPTKYPYFNAGFFMCNIKLGRKLNLFEEMCLFIKNYKPKLADQDTLNAIIGQKYYNLIYFLKPNFNVFSVLDYSAIMDKKYFYTPEEMNDASKNPAVIHFAGLYKPWHIDNYCKYQKIWNYYAKLSNIKIKRNKKYYLNMIFPLNSRRKSFAHEGINFFKKIKNKFYFNYSNFSNLNKLLVKRNPFSYLLNFCFNVACFFLKPIYRHIKKTKIVSYYKKRNVIDKTFNPLISVVVPNFNYSRYLKRRLKSIYHQKYKNIEVILLDDCSSDNSVKILKKYCKKYSRNTRLVINTENSGSVFKQWKKGLDLCRSNIVWIAESDDYNDKKFLINLKDSFKNKEVKISCGSCIGIKKSNIIYSQSYFCNNLNNWGMPFYKSYKEFLESGFGWENLIPNASQILFEKKELDFLIKKYNLFKMKFAGDWIAYHYILKSGVIYYNPSAICYHRLHDDNTSIVYGNTRSALFEYENIFNFLCSYSSVSNTVKIKYLLKYIEKCLWTLGYGSIPESTIKRFIDKIKEGYIVFLRNDLNEIRLINKITLINKLAKNNKTVIVYNERNSYFKKYKNKIVSECAIIDANEYTIESLTYSLNIRNIIY